uniref:CCM2_C domain-containing protein n=1 Tax=Panagrellus redivivus TaxID=6233 RepID=A0A7E4V198_PANRE
MMSTPASIYNASNPELRRFNVTYAGLVPEIRCDIDPSGRTDLLKVLDDAEINGNIRAVRFGATVVDDAILEVSNDGVRIQSLNGQAELLVVPVSMIASVGFVEEDSLNILPIRIGLSYEAYDLAVLYTKSKELAVEICDYMGSCFQSVYQESIANVNYPAEHDELNTFAAAPDAATPAPNPQPIVESSLSTSTSASSRRNEEMINEYITMISICLTNDELRTFAVLMARWRKAEIPIQEFGQKLLEIYGPSRKHLLARMKPLLRGISADDLDQLNKFMAANGITENAISATSPLMTAETSLTTEDGSFGPGDNIRFVYSLIF